MRGQFARNLRLWRHERGMSQTDLANAAGMCRPFVSKIERGHFSVILETLERLAGALNVEPSVLIGPLRLSRPQRDLRDLRKSRGLSQSKLAVESGISRCTINRIESGKSAAGPRARRAIADVLGVPASAIS